MPEYDLRLRTKSFALRIIRLYTTLPKSEEAQVIGKQVLRSATSVGSNYREAYRDMICGNGGSALLSEVAGFVQG